jgi:hypothetical protein
MNRLDKTKTGSTLCAPRHNPDRTLKEARLIVDEDAVTWFEHEAQKWSDRSGFALEQSKQVLAGWLRFFGINRPEFNQFLAS